MWKLEQRRYQGIPTHVTSILWTTYATTQYGWQLKCQYKSRSFFFSIIIWLPPIPPWRFPRDLCGREASLSTPGVYETHDKSLLSNLIAYSTRYHKTYCSRGEIYDDAVSQFIRRVIGCYGVVLNFILYPVAYNGNSTDKVEYTFVRTSLYMQ